MLMFKSTVWYMTRDNRMASSGDLLDAAFPALGSLDAAHKALHRATDFVRANAVSVEVTICTPRVEGRYPFGPGGPWVYGGHKTYPAIMLLGEPA